MNQLHYPKKPIGSLSALARIFSLDEERLIIIARNADQFYIANPPDQKPNGKIRQTYRINNPLKSIQGRILRSLLKAVTIPDYLQGGIEERDYIGDARLHAGTKVVIKEDVSEFFPSISDNLVRQMWKNLFHFPKQVADILTQLTTYKGFLPQGASTSTYIGNMVLWDLEPTLEQNLRERGFRYSRFVDDISVSTEHTVNKKDIYEITRSIYSMLRKKGLKPNKTKHTISRRNSALQVHGLNLNSGRTTIPEPGRNRIRAAVKELELCSISAESWDELKDQYNVIQGRLTVMARLHPREAKPYKDRLQLIRQKFSEDE